MCPFAAALSKSRDFFISCSSEACILKGYNATIVEQRKVKAIITVFDFNMCFLRQNILDNVAMHIGQSSLNTIVIESKLFVIDA